MGAIEGHVLALETVAASGTARLRGAAHRLREAGLDDIAGMLERHAGTVEAISGDLSREVGALLVLTDPTLDDTQPV
ncbi:MAG: hypothetical protein ACPGVG_17040 [Mycobacterium sp.]